MTRQALPPTEPSDRVVRLARDTDCRAWVMLRASMFRAMGVGGVDDSAWQQAAARWFDERSEDVHIVVVEVHGEVVATATGEGQPMYEHAGFTVHAWPAMRASLR